MNSVLNNPSDNPYLPREAVIVERIQESPTVFTLRLELSDSGQHGSYRFEPGQFNMLYLFGVGEIPISIVSDPLDDHLLDHTVRVVGRVTRALSGLQAGDRIGLRGPFGNGWPLHRARNKDVLILTGGLGCAPAVSVIRQVLKNRQHYGHLTIMQGVKHLEDLIWREQYEQWQKATDTEVLLAADVVDQDWHWQIDLVQGLVTALFDRVPLRADSSIVMMCGPEPMMNASAKELVQRGFEEQQIWMSMERNMQCGVGHCGHCQTGGSFVCKDGPVFPYPRIKPLLGIKGF